MDAVAGAGARGRSLATTPASSPRSFHKMQHGDVQVHREIVDTVFDAIPNASHATDQVAQVFATLRAASRGGLPTGDDAKDEIEPSRTQNGLWELKWKVRRGAKRELRLYHAEPDGGSPDFVALRFHLKSVVGGEDQIERDQDAEMALAMVRYADGGAVTARWGHSGSGGCSACVHDT